MPCAIEDAELEQPYPEGAELELCRYCAADLQGLTDWEFYCMERGEDPNQKAESLEDLARFAIEGFINGLERGFKDVAELFNRW
jgi:hypothetical protein